MDEKVITLEEIRERAKGTVIQIPDWDNKGTINVRVRMVDVTGKLLTAGVLPHSLKVEVAKAFEGEAKIDASKIDVDLNKIIPLLDTIVAEALVDPPYEEVQSILPLTLNQKLAIFNYVMGEVKQLEPFRS
ncbi:MAG: hypothetical protein HPY70_12655 [Firmicutes bacterium]|nr:hypothetical protein [Bacillota bacterium]